MSIVSDWEYISKENIRRFNVNNLEVVRTKTKFFWVVKRIFQFRTAVRCHDPAWNLHFIISRLLTFRHNPQRNNGQTHEIRFSLHGTPWTIANRYLFFISSCISKKKFGKIFRFHCILTAICKSFRMALLLPVPQYAIANVYIPERRSTGSLSVVKLVTNGSASSKRAYMVNAIPTAKPRKIFSCCVSCAY